MFVKRVRYMFYLLFKIWGIRKRVA